MCFLCLALNKHTHIYTTNVIQYNNSKLQILRLHTLLERYSFNYCNADYS